MFAYIIYLSQDENGNVSILRPMNFFRICRLLQWRTVCVPISKTSQWGQIFSEFALHTPKILQDSAVISKIVGLWKKMLLCEEFDPIVRED